MEVADLPLFARVAQRRLDPFELFLVHQVAVEGDEADVGAGVGVVALPAHVVEAVVHLLRAIVVADRGLELDAGVEQRRVRLLEFLDVVGGDLAAVHVVAEHDHEVEWERAVDLRHLLGHVVLGAIAGAVVAHRGELQRAGPVGQRRRLREQDRGRDRGGDERRQIQTARRGRHGDGIHDTPKGGHHWQRRQKC
jgi:hypothetical protein